MRIASVFLLIVLLLILAISSITALNKFRMPDVPHPVTAESMRTEYSRLAFSRRQTYVIEGIAVREEIVGFYDEWARNGGWYRVTNAEERWTKNDWERAASYVDWRYSYTAHWRDPHQKWSIRLILIQTEPMPDADQSIDLAVTVITEPFELMN